MLLIERGIEFSNYYHALRKGSVFYKQAGDPPKSLNQAEWSDSEKFNVGRLLMAAYETEFLFLPDEFNKLSRKEFIENYSEERIFNSHVIRHLYEREYFAEFHSQTSISGNWDKESLREYIFNHIENMAGEETKNLKIQILGSAIPKLATDFLAIQFAADFLVESSAMIRNVQGNYGVFQSELFKIIIDEYGYGVHKTKHSTLYQSLMKSIGLSCSPHYYFSWYLPKTILMNNYYNKISNNHSYFFIILAQ